MAVKLKTGFWQYLCSILSDLIQIFNRITETKPVTNK